MKNFARFILSSQLLCLVACTKAPVTQTIYVQAPAGSNGTANGPDDAPPATGGKPVESPPASTPNGDGFGGGGKALGKLEAARLLMVSALKKLKAEIDPDWLCEESALTLDQQDFCRTMILANLDELIARHTTDPIKFEISEASLADGLIAKTAYGPTGTILWSNAQIVDDAMTPARLVKFVLHESLHKLVKYLRDDDRPTAYPAANGGRVGADDAGQSLVDYAAAHLSYEDFVVALAPLGYWRMTDYNGGSLRDSSGHNLAGTLAGPLKIDGAKTPIAGSSGSSLAFSLTNGLAAQPCAQVRLAVPSINQETGTRVTVSFWMKWDGAVAAAQTSSIVFGFSGSYNLLMNGGALGFNTAHGDMLGVSNAGFANRWVHVVAVFWNGNPNRSKLYIDGSPAGDAAGKLTQFGNPAPESGTKVTANAFVGGRTDGYMFPFGGSVAELSMHSGELSGSQVKALYLLGAGKY